MGESGKRRALETVRSALVNASKVELVGADVQIDDTLLLHFNVDGSNEVTLSADGIRVVRGDMEALARPKESLRGRLNRYRFGRHLSIAQLRERNLPLYWNREWLVRELEECGSYAEIARKHGYPSSTTIASYAKRNFGISVQDSYDQKRAAVIEAHQRITRGESPRRHYAEMAEQHNVSIATIYRWIREHREGHTLRSRQREHTTPTNP